jgi:hypothetical protein
MKTIWLVLFAAAALFLWAGPGQAHDHEEEPRGRHDRAAPLGGEAAPAGEEARYRKECGACHLAYPPAMLPAAAWRRTMAGLERHFGQNAELDSETGAALERWLVARAGGSRHQPANQAAPRLTETPAFSEEHGEIDRRVLARSAVRSLANCSACHPGAAKWDFDEERAKIPDR